MDRVIIGANLKFGDFPGFLGVWHIRDTRWPRSPAGLPNGQAPFKLRASPAAGADPTAANFHMNSDGHGGTYIALV